MVLTAIASTRVVALSTGCYALVVELSAFVVWDSLRVHRDIGAQAVDADAGPVKGLGIAGV